MDFEIIVLVTPNEQASWLRCLLIEMPLWKKLVPTVLIHGDNNGSITKKKLEL